MYSALYKYFNALIMPCDAPYNALYNLMNNCNYIYNTCLITEHTFRKYNALKQPISESANIIMHWLQFFFYVKHYNAHNEYLYNALYIRASSKVLPNLQ